MDYLKKLIILSKSDKKKKNQSKETLPISAMQEEAYMFFKEF